VPSPNTPSGNRRQFLETAGLLAATVALPGCATMRPTGRPAWKTAVGLNGFQSGVRKYDKTYPIWEVLEFTRGEGFDGVELVSDWPQGGYPAAAETSRVQALRSLYDRFGLRIFSLQQGAAGAFDPHTATRRGWIEQVADRLQLARQLGCSCIGLWPGGGLRGQSIDEAIGRLAESFWEVAGLAAKAGILVAFEIEPPFVFNSEDHLRRILEAVNHPNLKTIYDPSHFDLMNGSTGRPHEMLERIGVDQIGYVHLTDTDGTLRDGGTSTHLACGDGHANIPESLRELRAGGFSGWIMIDAWEIPDPYDACRKGLAMIQREAARPPTGE
jgi:sugar phosphate isomerase/epimerase